MASFKPSIVQSISSVLEENAEEIKCLQDLNQELLRVVTNLRTSFAAHLQEFAKQQNQIRDNLHHINCLRQRTEKLEQSTGDK